MLSRPPLLNDSRAIDHRLQEARERAKGRVADRRGTRPSAARATAALIVASLGACAKVPGWSADEEQKTRDQCLTQVGTTIELEQARAYCDCVVAKTIEQHPRYADAERAGAESDGERFGETCAADLGLGKPAAAAAAADTHDQDVIQEEPRVYGEWQVEFVPRRAGVDEPDTWQAIGLDTRDGSARLAYVCDSDAYCGFVFQPAATCDAGRDEPAVFALLFSLPNGRSVAQTEAHCLPNGAWGFVSVDPILERFRDAPEAVKLTLRGESWDFSLDGAAAAFAYCERAAGGQGGADAGAAAEPTAQPQR
jgi:hypothetical protein